MSVTLGTHKTIDKLRKAIQSAGIRIFGDDTNNILTQVSISPTKVQLDVVIVTGADLGFVYPVSRVSLYARALEMGLQLCPAEVGPQLRLQYPTSIQGNLCIAMEPITSRHPHYWMELVFDVGDVGRSERALGTGEGRPDMGFCAPNERWVFVQPGA
jgi:hypothetical protein